MGKEASDMLFENEILFLEEAENYLAGYEQKGQTGDAELLSRYKEICANYSKLVKEVQIISRISDRQEKALKCRENDISNLLNNLSQGFFTFGKDLLVQKEYSAECQKIFRKKITNVSVLELLSSENNEKKELFREVFSSVFEEPDPDEKNRLLEKLPVVIELFNSYYHIKYKLVCANGFEGAKQVVMIMLTDITEKKKSEDKVEYLSFHDSLTSLYNRAYIDNIMPQLFSEKNYPLSLVMADMNALKPANDIFGHEFGDKRLIDTAEVLMKCCRRNDVVARWGGDEFLIVLPGADSSICHMVCDRIKQACAQVPADPIELSLALGCVTIESPVSNPLELLGIAEKEMYDNKAIESKDMRKKIFLSLEAALESRVPGYVDHIKRVGALSEKLAKLAGIEFSERELADLGKLVRLHDIGKAALPAATLKKGGPLTKDEFNSVMRYTQIGYRMAQFIDEPVVAEALLYLREKWDGSGYPQGLRGEQIPLLSRIVSIAEAFDVMTNDCGYKKTMTVSEAFAEIKRCSGTQFDPSLAAAILDNKEALSGRRP